MLGWTRGCGYERRSYFESGMHDSDEVTVVENGEIRRSAGPWAASCHESHRAAGHGCVQRRVSYLICHSPLIRPDLQLASNSHYANDSRHTRNSHVTLVLNF